MLAPNSPIRLVAGLGNPDREYLRTRHNAGFWFADALARKLSLTFRAEKNSSATLPTRR
jgi:PTH1 family peptidyl-tRNA hydrolase